MGSLSDSISWGLGDTVGNTSETWRAWTTNRKEWLDPTLPKVEYGTQVVVGYDLLEKTKEEVREMRGLFCVIAVDPEEGEVVLNKLVVAKDKNKAELKVLGELVEKYDLDDLDIICNRLGDVRAKKQVQEVRVVKG